MSHLSSCYFCGTALDDTLRDYRVVPVELRETDETTTATLCQSCHGKLERLLAPVVEAAGSEESNETITDTAEGDAGGDESDPLLADVETDLVDIDEEPVAESDDGDTADETTDGGDEKRVRITHETEETTATEESEPDPENGDGTETTGESETSGGPKAGTEDETKTGDDTGDEVSIGTEDEVESGEEQQAATGSEDGGDGSDTAQTTMSALEYNKVMRLLQNREFPVDRREFVTVAANAYGLAEHECAEVIDLAIDRGLVAEQDEQLVRPES